MQGAVSRNVLKNRAKSCDAKSVRGAVSLQLCLPVKSTNAGQNKCVSSAYVRFMSKVLIVNFCLSVGGGEKLVYELANFALQNDKQPVILIPNNYKKEYYDPIFKKMGIKVIRTRLSQIATLRHPINILKAIYWRLRFQYFSKKEFSSVHVINLSTAEMVHDIIKHDHRYYWHICNVKQYVEGEMPYPRKLFSNPKDSLVLINDFQESEINSDYGSVPCKKVRFKLFVS